MLIKIEYYLYIQILEIHFKLVCDYINNIDYYSTGLCSMMDKDFNCLIVLYFFSLLFREPGTGAAGSGEAAMTSEGGEVVEDLDLQNLQELANNADVDEQDVPMNAGGLGMMAGGGAQLRRHRDLVDYLYMLTMLGFLALISYVTGSFGRLMVFAGGIIFMML